MKNKRILGIDFGDVRTGLAVSDLSGTLAGGIGYIKNYSVENAAMQIVEKIKELDVGTVVIGHPINMNGTLGPRSEKAHALKSQLSELLPECEYVLFDERCTTLSAYQYMQETNIKQKKRRETVDTLSAQILLQNYMDSVKKI